MTPPWGRAKRRERKAADEALTAENARWLHTVIAETERGAPDEAATTTSVKAPRHRRGRGERRARR